ncbi:hypothetical protein OAP14_04620 [Aliiglaciecola sp.]|nr:hypothetical protein [Aliiglaciecola sp.]
MNRSSKGFGLAGVFATVLFLVVMAVMSSSANAAPTASVQLTSQI